MIYLALDIGGTAVKMSLVSGAGNILRRAEHSVSFDHYKTPILRTVLSTVAAFLREADEKPSAIGVAATGQIDVSTGMVVGTCGNLPGWLGVPLRDSLAEAFRLPVYVENDANCALLGEAWLGRAQGCRHALLVTLGTGVGGAAIVDGRVLHGRIGIAGEIGHFPTHADGAVCTCGNRGCYEQYASVTALRRMMESQAQGASADGRHIFRKAAAGDQAAVAALDLWIGEVAAGLIGLVHLFNPQIVLIGGGVSAQDTMLIDPLRWRVLSGVMPRFREGLALEAAGLGNDAGMLGAARLCLDVHGK